MSQKNNILKHLQKFDSISPMEALQKYGCFRLSERIRECEREGYLIEHDRNIGKKRYSIYRLIK